MTPSRITACPDPPARKPPEADAETLQERLDEMRAIARDRVDSSIYLDVRNGKARVALPGGRLLFVKEGEGIRLWPRYLWRDES